MTVIPTLHADPRKKWRKRCKTVALPELRAQMLHMALEFAARLSINGTDQILRLADRMYDYVANGKVPSE